MPVSRHFGHKHAADRLLAANRTPPGAGTSTGTEYVLPPKPRKAQNATGVSPRASRFITFKAIPDDYVRLSLCPGRWQIHMYTHTYSVHILASALAIHTLISPRPSPLAVESFPTLGAKGRFPIQVAVAVYITCPVAPTPSSVCSSSFARITNGLARILCHITIASLFPALA